MTEEERRNRNPKPEVHPYNRAEHPLVPLGQLERHRVYVLDSQAQGGKFIVTMNYLGECLAMDPLTLRPVVCHEFTAPRIGDTVALRPTGDGNLMDAEGHVIEVRRFDGPDA
jgi:hypothetical protein